MKFMVQVYAGAISLEMSHSIILPSCNSRQTKLWKAIILLVSIIWLLQSSHFHHQSSTFPLYTPTYPQMQGCTLICSYLDIVSIFLFKTRKKVQFNSSTLYSWTLNQRDRLLSMISLWRTLFELERAAFHLSIYMTVTISLIWKVVQELR
jgi:hypothetical protein